MQANSIQGCYEGLFSPPSILGSEVYGTVVKIGHLVEDFGVGDRIAGSIT